MKKIHPEPILLKKGAGTNALYWVDPPTKKSHWSMVTFSIADHKFSMFRLALIVWCTFSHYCGQIHFLKC